MPFPSFLHGKNTRVLFAQPGTASYDISQFFNDVSVGFAKDAPETTTFSNGGVRTFIQGIRDGSISLGGYYDGTTAGVDAILQAAITNSGNEGVVVFPDGTSSTATVSRCHLARGVNSSYNIKSPVSGVVSIDTAIQADGGVWRGQGQNFTISGAGTTNYPTTGGYVDNGAATTSGGILVMGVTALSGTSPTAVLTFQHSSDGTNWSSLTGGTASGLNGLANVLTGSIYRYTRLNVVLGGTSPSATIYYGFARF